MAPSKFYNLPPSWNPGYVIPDYVMAEPPERGVFVTQWMPRGTIPALIPEFYARPGKKLLGRNDAGLGSLGGTVFDEKTLTGSTLRGSTLSGSTLGATEYQLEPLSGSKEWRASALGGTKEWKTRAATVGMATAKKVIAGIQRLPAKHRGAAMKKAMNRIDPTLYGRAMAFTNQARARGMHPAKAVEYGIATALTQPAQSIGKRTSSPSQLRSPRRLGGKRGMTALGADKGATTMDATDLYNRTHTATPVAGVCSSDGAFVFDGVSWQRRMSGAPACQIYYTGTIDVRTGQGGGVTVTQTPSGVGDGKGPYTVINNIPSDDSSGASGQLLQAGPFNIPLAARNYTIHFQRGSQWPAEWLDFITQELAHDCSNCIITSMTDATEGHTFGVLRDFFGAATPPMVNKDLVSIAAPKLVGASSPSYGGSVTPPRNSPGQIVVELNMPDQPIVLVDRPDTGETWGLYMIVAPKDPSYPWDSTFNPYELSIYWKQRPEGVWDWIKKIHGIIHDAITQAACQMVPAASKTPNIYAQAGAAALTLTGECQQNCPQGMVWNPQLNSCQAIPSSFGGLLPWVLVGGLGIIGLYVATR